VTAVLGGLEADFALVSKVGPDFLYHGEILARPVVARAPTTAFLDDYRGEERVSFCTAICEPILPEDLPDGEFSVGMACGLVGEVGPATLAALRARARIVVADAQGLLREVDRSSGAVRNRRLENTEFAASLRSIDFLKASREEARSIDLERARGLTTLLITEGPRGCTILTATGETRVDAVPVPEVDSTGAGDCFLAGFAVALARGLEPVSAARFGNACGAIAVGHVGVPAPRAFSFVFDSPAHGAVKVSAKELSPPSP
jgi:1D-myo-inositol 3-kinase